jgi:hypothetical protein
MLRNSTTKIALVLLSVVFLLVNPAGVCAGSPMTKSPSHPCCPTSPTHDSAKTNCVCIDRQPAPPSVPSNDTGEQMAVATADLTPRVAADQRSPEFGALLDVALASQDRCVQFHQLLV